MDAHLSAYFSEHLAQQCKQSHYHLSCLLVSMPALLPVGQVLFFNVIVLRPQSMFAQLRTDATHHLVCSHGAFPKQLHVSGETHPASISFGADKPVYIFRNANATLPSGVKKDFRPRLTLLCIGRSSIRLNDMAI